MPVAKCLQGQTFTLGGLFSHIKFNKLLSTSHADPQSLSIDSIRRRGDRTNRHHTNRHGGTPRAKRRGMPELAERGRLQGHEAPRVARASMSAPRRRSARRRRRRGPWSRSPGRRSASARSCGRSPATTGRLGPRSRPYAPRRAPRAARWRWRSTSSTRTRGRSRPASCGAWPARPPATRATASTSSRGSTPRARPTSSRAGATTGSGAGASAMTTATSRPTWRSST